MKPIPFNEKLIWDYDIPPDAQENEAFREWYVGRVLTHGMDVDIRALGIKTIHQYFPRLSLPKEIHEFWYWFFNLPEQVERYGKLAPIEHLPRPSFPSRE